MESDYGSKSNVDKVHTDDLSTHYHPLNSGYSVASLQQLRELEGVDEHHLDLEGRLNHWDPEDNEELPPRRIITYINKVLCNDPASNKALDYECEWVPKSKAFALGPEIDEYWSFRDI